MNFAGSSGGGECVNFLPVASPSHAEETVEPKICEWCSATFWRPVPLAAREGAKQCARCMERVVRARESAIEQTRKRLRSDLNGRVA
jgi:hypothetical protein